MDRFLVLAVMGCVLLLSGVIWAWVRPRMSWIRRLLIASCYAAAGAGFFYVLQRLQDPVAGYLSIVLYGGFALLVACVDDPMLQLMQRVAERKVGDPAD